jgi:hypothetical protein
MQDSGNGDCENESVCRNPGRVIMKIYSKEEWEEIKKQDERESEDSHYLNDDCAAKMISYYGVLKHFAKLLGVDENIWKLADHFGSDVLDHGRAEASAMCVAAGGLFFSCMIYGASPTVGNFAAALKIHPDILDQGLEDVSSLPSLQSMLGEVEDLIVGAAAVLRLPGFVTAAALAVWRGIADEISTKVKTRQSIVGAILLIVCEHGGYSPGQGGPDLVYDIVEAVGFLTIRTTLQTGLEIRKLESMYCELPEFQALSGAS